MTTADRSGRGKVLPSRRANADEGKPVLITRAFGKRSHLGGRIGYVESEKLRGFFLVEVDREPNGPKDLSYFHVVREVRASYESVEGLLDWADPAFKKPGERRRMANYVLRFDVDGEAIHADECDWQPLFCIASEENGTHCAGKLVFEGADLKCEKCGATASGTEFKGFPAALRHLRSADHARSAAEGAKR